jgi:uncharacterized repeat protein (TIGR03843 family)
VSARAADLEALLSVGEIDIEGRLRDSSNAAMRVVCTQDGVGIRAVYKPLRGERPLWDFPTGTLGRREAATSLIDRALGWDLVPVTVWRDETPLGPGSLQAWIDADPDAAPVDVVDAQAIPEGWHIVAEGEGDRGDHVCLVHEESEGLRRIALLDAIANNADRKGGHVLRSQEGLLAGIDHGLTFHEEPKLRTVLWGWAGSDIEESALDALHALDAAWPGVAVTLQPLLSRREIDATRSRLSQLIDLREYPSPEGAWPALPWPAM